MSLTKNEIYLLKEVFTKVKYDKLNNRFYIALEDYGFLNLDPPQLILLKNMCTKNNIYLETLPKRLKGIETQELFEKYKKIEEKIENTLDDTKKQKLKSELMEIRDKIILGHMRQVYYLINKRIPELKNDVDREDIYQIGYETLIEFFDKYNPERDTTFSYFINEFIFHRIVRKIYRNNNVLGSNTLMLLTKIKKAKQQLEDEKIDYSIEDLIKKTGIKEDRLKELLILEELITMSTTDFEEESLKEELINYHFEDDMIEHIISKAKPLEKIVDLLPENERMVIRLRCGFEDGKKYSYEEIAKKMGVSRQRVEQLKESGLTIIANSSGRKYLKDMYGETKYTEKNKENTYSSLSDERQKRELIISTVDIELILSIINTFHPLNKEIMLLHYGLKDGKKYEVEEICEIINLRKPEVSKRVKSSTELLIKRIVKKENPHFEGDCLEYLMNKYLNKPKRK